MNNFFAELKRRNVFKVGVAYAVVAWAIMQFVDIIQDPFGLPEWFQRVTVVALVIGLPIALLLSWAYEVTPEGVKKTAEVDKASSITPKTGARINKVIAAGFVLALAFISYDKFVAPDGATVHEALAGSASIAVLPFADLSSTQDQGYFADGISEEILNVLAKIPDLKVAGRTSSFTFKGQNKDLREIAEKLGVNYVLEGSVRKDNEKVRITAQLISASDGFHLWSETYDRQLTDIFSVQDEISNAVADALEIQLGVGDKPATQKAAVNPEAYSLYLRARQAFHARTGELMEQARSLFETAVILDPKISEAWSGLSLTYGLLPFYKTGGVDPREMKIKGRAAAEKALALNPGNAEAYSTLSIIFLQEFDWKAAALSNAKAEALAPNDAEVANFIGDFYRFTFDTVNAIKWEKHAYDLDPLHEVQARDLAFAYLSAGEYENALKYASVSEQLAPDNIFSMQVKVYALTYMKKFNEAHALLDRWESNSGENRFVFVTAKGVLAIVEGKHQEALNCIKELQQLEAEGKGSPAIISYHFALNGDLESALKWYEKAYRERSQGLTSSGFWLPEYYTDDPAIIAKFDLPGMKELFDLRRANIARNAAAKQ